MTGKIISGLELDTDGIIGNYGSYPRLERRGSIGTRTADAPGI